VVTAFGPGLLQVAAHDGDTLDQFRHPLREQEREGERDKEFDRPLREAAGVLGLLVLEPGNGGIVPGCVDDESSRRQQEEDVADQFNDVAGALGELGADNVDADVLVVLERPGGGKKEGDSKHPPLQLEPGIGGGIKQFADDGIAGTDDGCEHDQPGDRAADPRIQRIDCAAQRE
jgi:hypothetical protein